MNITKEIKMMYFVYFEYRHWCQGYERGYERVLVRDADSFDEACRQIMTSGQWDLPKNFENKTI